MRMRTDELSYELPEDLIAQEPTPDRDRSRMLFMDRKTGHLSDTRFDKIVNYLNAGDCLVLNDTRVLPGRFYARRSSGAQLEGLFLRENTPGEWEVLLKNARKIKTGETIILTDSENRDYISVKILENIGEGIWRLQLPPESKTADVLRRTGYAPLPPYIRRQRHDERKNADLERYQTVFAQKEGAIAAPTAGLHFTPALLNKIRAIGIEIAYVTLHVGIGTFRPVTAEELTNHAMHWEEFELSPDNAQIINKAKTRGGRVIAVGTTSVRTLETLGGTGRVKPASGQTKLFILPGYEFRIIDGLVTNFHLPKSTLLALVAAFAGLENTLAAYQHAVRERYRFFSYGDAMLIL